MKYINYIYAVILVTGLALTACDKADGPAMNDDMLQIEGITLGLGSLDEAPAQASTRATVRDVVYAVNTPEDPTWGSYLLTKRSAWKLDFHLYNGNPDGTTPYEEASFDGGGYFGSTWKTNDERQLLFPNYFRPEVEAWLYPDTRNKDVAFNQQSETDFLAQDLLHRPKSELNPIAKKFTVELQHQRAMLNFKFEGVVRNDIDEESVKVIVGGTNGEGGMVYTPYSVRTGGILEYMLILPETTLKSSEILVTYSTKATGIHQAINYKQKVTLDNTSGNLGSNNAYCFTLSGKNLAISPVTIVNWVTGEPVSGQYVAVTAYPTFKGPKITTYYFYYDNQLTVDGTLTGAPKLQEINFNRDGECTIKPDGRILTHIFPATVNGEAPEDMESYELENPVILGGSAEGKMYIDLTSIIGG